MSNNKLIQKGIDILTKQYYDREKSRELIKLKNNGRYARYDVISSSNSLKQHIIQWNQFAIYIYEKHNIKSLRKITEDLVIDFLTSEIDKNLAEKTLKSRVTAINHVMVGSGVWNTQQRVSLKDMRSKDNISRSKGALSVYKDYTSEEWRERFREDYKANYEAIDISRAFGLRRSEIYGKKGSKYNGLTFRNLGHLENSRILFAEVIGKGGKYRIAPVREDMASIMWERYGSRSKSYRYEYFQKNEAERKKILLASNTNNDECLFQTENRSIPLHINRNEYVLSKLKERQNYWETKRSIEEVASDKATNNIIGYSRINFKYNDVSHETSIYRVSYKNKIRHRLKVDPFSIVKIGTWQGYVIAATDVMRYVGHNRLDVLNRYL